MKHFLRTPNHRDPRLLRQLRGIECGLLGLAFAVSIAELLYWLGLLPDWVEAEPWALMKANAALCLGLLAAALALPDSPRGRRFAALAAVPVLLLALATLAEYGGLPLSGLDQWLARDPAATLPGRMAWQTALALVLLSGIVLLPASDGRRAVWLADLLLGLLAMLLIGLVAGYVYGVLQIYGSSASLRTAPQTLLALIALALALILRRLPASPAAVLLSSGNAGQVGRRVLPAALLPILLPLLSVAGAAAFAMEPPMASAIVAALTTMLAATGFIWMARHIDRFESELRRLSLLDELTGVHNRRGFMLLARHALRHARRDGEAVSLLFIDVDGLKLVNDRFGHEAGSEMLRAVAALLEQTFRDSDIIGRMGGDEFCVLAPGANAVDVQRRVQELDVRVRDFNLRQRQPYALSFSTGIAQLEAISSGGLEAALRAADAAMYRAKQARKAAVAGVAA